MKVAVLGPVTKDFIKIDGEPTVQIGGIPYYVAVALKSLGAEEVAPYVTCGAEDRNWMKENFSGLEVKYLPAEKTLESHIEFKTANPDARWYEIRSFKNTIEPDEDLIKELNNFDYIIFGPLFYDNIPLVLFEKLKHKNLVLGEYGLFSYEEKGKFVWKNPENLIKVLPFLKYLFLDKNEAEFASGQKGAKESAEFLLNHGLANMIITEGSNGSHLYLGERYYKISSYPPSRIADITGAGDTYLAAFIRAQELFKRPEEQGRFAAMVASMSLENKGAFKRSLEEVMEKLNS